MQQSAPDHNNMQVESTNKQGAREQYPEPGMDEASLEDRVPLSEILEDQGQEDDMQNKIRKYREKTQELHADEEFLLQELKVRQKETLESFSTLMNKKKQLFQHVMTTFNRQSAPVDIAIAQELTQLRKIIQGQQTKIDQLKTQISKQGIAGVLTDDKQFRMKAKAQEMQKQIKVGRKFSSTQYVRDYLQRPQAYKVSYEQSKYEFELRVRIKDCLQQQKKVYQKKKQEINQIKRRQRQREQELLKEKDLWSR